MKETIGKLNIGNADRVLRIGIGTAVLLTGFYYQALWGFLGLIPFFTGVVGYCPAYQLLHFSTRKKQRQDRGTCCETTATTSGKVF